MTSLEKKVRSFLDQHQIEVTEQEVNLLLHQCAGVARNLFENAAEFARCLPPIAELQELAGELFAELVQNGDPNL